MADFTVFTSKDFTRTNTANVQTNKLRDQLREVRGREPRLPLTTEITLTKPPTGKKKLPTSKDQKTAHPSQLLIVSKDSANKLTPQQRPVRKTTHSPISRPTTVNTNFEKTTTRTISLPKKLEEDSLSQSLPNYLIKTILGKGAYATVRLGVHKQTLKKFAIKTYEKYQILDPMKKKILLREIEILNKLDHPNIVKLFETVDSKKHFHLVLEYVNGGSLYSYIKSKPNGTLEEYEAKRIFKQVLSAIEYCHSQSIAHRDIKLDNILLDSKQNVKIIDFGFSTPNSEEKSRVFCGTPSYMAPEIVCRKDYSGINADVWALGILLYAMLCGKMPFKAYSDKELYRRIEKGSFVIPPHFAESLKMLLGNMLEVNPRKRLSIKMVTEHDWVCSSGILRSITQNLPVKTYESDSLDLEIISGIVINSLEADGVH